MSSHSGPTAKAYSSNKSSILSGMWWACISRPRISRRSSDSSTAMVSRQPFKETARCCSATHFSSRTRPMSSARFRKSQSGKWLPNALPLLSLSKVWSPKILMAPDKDKANIPSGWNLNRPSQAQKQRMRWAADRQVPRATKSGLQCHQWSSEFQWTKIWSCPKIFHGKAMPATTCGKEQILVGRELSKIWPETRSEWLVGSETLRASFRTTWECWETCLKATIRVWFSDKTGYITTLQTACKCRSLRRSLCCLHSEVSIKPPLECFRPLPWFPITKMRLQSGIETQWSIRLPGQTSLDSGSEVISSNFLFLLSGLLLYKYYIVSKAGYKLLLIHKRGMADQLQLIPSIYYQLFYCS